MQLTTQGPSKMWGWLYSINDMRLITRDFGLMQLMVCAPPWLIDFVQSCRAKKPQLQVYGDYQYPIGPLGPLVPQPAKDIYTYIFQKEYYCLSRLFIIIFGEDGQSPWNPNKPVKRKENCVSRKSQCCGLLSQTSHEAYWNAFSTGGAHDHCLR